MPFTLTYLHFYETY